MITAGNIKVYSGYAISRIVDMEVDIRKCCHGKLTLRAYLDNTSVSGDDIKVMCSNADGQEDILYNGVVQNAYVFFENGVKQVILTAKTSSVRMDRQENNRSFQDTSMTYVEIIG